MKYTREQLESMGLNENQINAILNTITPTASKPLLSINPLLELPSQKK